MSTAKHTPEQRAAVYCADLRRYGLAPTVPRLMRAVRGLLRSQARNVIAKATGGKP